MDQKLPRLQASLGIRSKDGTIPRRPLTPPGTRKKTIPQSTCSFFSLPYEIRLIIYREVIDSWDWGTKIHIHRSTHFRREKTGPGYLTAIPCRAVERSPEYWARVGEDIPNARPAHRRTRLGLETYGVFPDACLDCANGYWGYLSTRTTAPWSENLFGSEDKLAMFLVCRKM
jgi:hypothetical protein